MLSLFDIVSGGIGLLIIITITFFMAMERKHRAEESIIRQLVKGPRTGLDLVNNSGGLLRRGTVYVHLHRLEERGLVRSAEIPFIHRGQQLPRRIYTLKTQ